MIQEELSGEIIGAGMNVLNELRPGLDEKLYERAMIIELKRRGHSLSIQRAFPVFYRSELIGNLIRDLIVDDAVIVDPKGGGLFHRHARSSNARVSKYHRVGSGPAA